MWPGPHGPLRAFTGGHVAWFEYLPFNTALRWIICIIIRPYYFRAPCATEEDDRVPSPARLDAARRGPVRVPGTVTNVALVAVVPVHHAARTAAGKSLE